MTDRGSFRLMQDGSRSSNRLQILGRIAEVLDMSVAEFYWHDAEIAESDVPSTAECERMLKVFLRVKDAEARTRIIATMRACSGN